MSASPSPVELLHPRGVVERAVVLGSACPRRLMPERPAADAEGCDLSLVVPSRAELATPGWLEQAARAAATLAPDGIAYAIVPPRARLRLLRELGKHGLTRQTAFAHLPGSNEPRYLVPLTAPSGLYALSSLIPIRAGRRRLARAALRHHRSRELLGLVWPDAGVAARRPEADPLGAWLFALDGSRTNGSPPIITAGSRRSPSFVLHRMSSDRHAPTGVAKVRSDGTAEVESELLRRLAPAARAAGAAVPQPLAVESDGARSVLLESPLEGRSAAVLLADAPRNLVRLHEQLASWLAAWNTATAAVRDLDDGRLAEALLEPAAAVAAFLDDGAGYVSWLEERCSRVRGGPFPLVATHNDLTMSNVFMSDAAGLGVVDWETARPEGWPLGDFAYAAVDAAAATSRYANRKQAFLACFGRGGRHAEHVRSLWAAQVRALPVRPELVQLCFHACWLHHAVNEGRAAEAAAPRPFMEILRVVARERDEFFR